MLPLSVEPLTPLGAHVHGIDPSTLRALQSNGPVLAELERLAALHGFLVFANQSLPGDALVGVSQLFGSGTLAARHTVHPAAVHDDIFRVSNDATHGVYGVGPQWHSDGSTERRVFSHILFHPQQMPAAGGGTQFTDLAGAYASLPAAVQDEWSRLAIVNAFSGSVHPLVHTHPLTGRPCLFVHLGMVGAVIRWRSKKGRRRQAAAETTSSAGAAACAARAVQHARLEAMEPTAGLVAACGHELLRPSEVRALLAAVDRQLSRAEHATTYTFRSHRRRAPTINDDDDHRGNGDLVLVDNLAAAHKATVEAHDPAGGLRILHRTTLEGTWPLDPPPDAHLPPFAYVWGDNPLGEAQGGLWRGSDHFGVGFRWNQSIAMRN